MAKRKDETKKFTGIFVPAKVLAMKNISMVEKLIITDVGYFPNSYHFTNDNLAKKFGVSRRTIINSVKRLKSTELGFLIDIESVSRGRYLRHLKLSEKGLVLLSKDGVSIAPCSDKDGAEVAPYGAEVAPCSDKDGAEVAPIDKQTVEEHLDNKSKGRKKFQKPTPEEVSKYAKSISFDLDGQYFVDSYKAKGWMIGKNKMKDWEATVRTWKNRRKVNNDTSRKHRQDTQYRVPAEYAAEAIEV